jgi:hypothetical protein
MHACDVPAPMNYEVQATIRRVTGDYSRGLMKFPSSRTIKRPGMIR